MHKTFTQIFESMVKSFVGGFVLAACGSDFPGQEKHEARGKRDARERNRDARERPCFLLKVLTIVFYLLSSYIM
jgi:hypothetical protein